MAMLLIREPTQAKHLFETTNQTQLTIGRSIENGLSLHHASVSRVHAALYESSGKWTIEDLKSRNGTFVNGRRVKRAALRTTDTVRIGDYELVYFGERDTNADGFRGIRQWRAPRLDLADEETHATTMEPGLTRHTATVRIDSPPSSGRSTRTGWRGGPGRSPPSSVARAASRSPGSSTWGPLPMSPGIGAHT
jgi:hypothetical protein